MAEREVLKAEKILLEEGNLPTLPVVFDQLSTLIRNPRTSVMQVSKIVETDPAISARVLRLVNSAFYGYGGKIKTVKRAVVILGFDALSNIILSLSVFRAFGEGESHYLDKVKLWEHSILVAVISEFIAERTKRIDPEEAFTAGILHDIGKLILDQYLGEEYGKAFKMVFEEGIELYEAEWNLWGLNHTEIGDAINEVWNIPPSITSAISSHHKPDMARYYREFVYTVHLANYLANSLEKYSPKYAVDYMKVDEEAWRYLDLTADKVKWWLPQILNRYEKSKVLLHIAEQDSEAS